MKRLLNRHGPTIGGVIQGQTEKEDQAPPITGAGPTAVKNLVKRNGKVLHLARKLTNQRNYMQHLDEKIYRRKEAEMLRSLSPQNQSRYRTIVQETAG